MFSKVFVMLFGILWQATYTAESHFGNAENKFESISDCILLAVKNCMSNL